MFNDDGLGQAMELSALRDRNKENADKIERIYQKLDRIEQLLSGQGHGWQPMSTAPKGGGAERTDDPNWVDPPMILLKFGSLGVSVASWCHSHAEGGYYCTDGFAWIEPCSGDPLNQHFDAEPDGWLPLEGFGL